MASIFDMRETPKKLKSGMLASSAGHEVSRPLKYNNDAVSAGWPAYIQNNGNMITSSANDGNQCFATGPYERRIKETDPWRYMCYFRGIIYTSRNGLSNPGDIIGNLLCLGSAPAVASGKPNEATADSRICLILKKAKDKN